MYHCEFPSLVDGKVHEMRKKQEMYSGDRSHANLRALDALVALGAFTYAGWRDDVNDAERCHCKHSNLDKKLQAVRTKQGMHSRDRSHATLCALDALLASGLTYAGWRNDVKEVERYHVEYPMLVDWEDDVKQVENYHVDHVWPGLVNEKLEGMSRQRKLVQRRSCSFSFFNSLAFFFCIFFCLQDFLSPTSG